MEQVSVYDRTYHNEDYKTNTLAKGEYEHCYFVHCDFSECNLLGIVFIDCEFTGCNLSLAKLSGAAFRGAIFKECKMLGLHFDQAHPFGLSLQFSDCVLNHASFYQLKLKKTNFSNCQLHEVDFTEADLSSSVISHCDLKLAVFDRTNLEKTDLRTSYNYSIDPAGNRIKKAKFSLSAIAGLLDVYDIVIDHRN